MKRPWPDLALRARISALREDRAFEDFRRLMTEPLPGLPGCDCQECADTRRLIREGAS